MTAYERDVRAALKALAEDTSKEGKDRAAAARKALAAFDAERVGQCLRGGIPPITCVERLIAD